MTLGGKMYFIINIPQIVPDFSNLTRIGVRLATPALRHYMQIFLMTASQ